MAWWKSFSTSFLETRTSPLHPITENFSAKAAFSDTAPSCTGKSSRFRSSRESCDDLSRRSADRLYRSGRGLCVCRVVSQPAERNSAGLHVVPALALPHGVARGHREARIPARQDQEADF